MNKIIFILFGFLLLFIYKNSYAQYMPSIEDLLVDDVIGNFELDTRSTISLQRGSAYNIYNNLQTWIPYCNSEPLKTPPITYIEVSFHVFLDDNGGNNNYTNTTAGINKLLYLLQTTNQIYSGEWGPSDPVNGVVPLPNNDTRIRFTLGDNNERIYFYNNSILNKKGSSSAYNEFYRHIQTNHPERNTKLNVYFTAGHYLAHIKQEDIIITNEGSGYTSPPTITFSSGNAKATATVQNGKLTAITLTDNGNGSYNNFDPPTINITGGGGSGATAKVTKLNKGATGYSNMPPPPPNLSTNSYVVMCHCYESGDWVWGMTLAHEFAHWLDLRHVACGGNASPVMCNNHCSKNNCTLNAVTCSDDEYLSDIFGPCPGTYPHITGWVDPYDNNIPDAKKHTNNVMGGSHTSVYFSPMQVGQMHRTLALKSTRKYVKKETYSSIPLVINSTQVWDFNLKLYRDVNIASGSVLTLASIFDFPYNGTITVNSGAALVISNSVKLSENNKIIVKNGGTLKIESGSTTEISDNGYIEVQSGGYFCLASGAVIKLVDAESSIKLMPGYLNDVNTSIIPSGSCTASPGNYSIVGNGKIKDYTNDIYIQNETITSNQYYIGKNIYVGSNVTTTKPQGDVLITNNANVIFDAAEDVVLDAGFECEIGASFEIK